MFVETPAAAACLLLGGIVTARDTVMVSTIQVVVPSGMIGRMMSCAQFIGYGLTPVGSLFGGLIGRNLPAVPRGLRRAARPGRTGDGAARAAKLPRRAEEAERVAVDRGKVPAQGEQGEDQEQGREEPRKP